MERQEIERRVHTAMQNGGHIINQGPGWVTFHTGQVRTNGTLYGVIFLPIMIVLFICGFFTIGITWILGVLAAGIWYLLVKPQPGRVVTLHEDRPMRRIA